MLAAGPLAPPWAIFPMALVTMVILAAHLAGLARAEMPESRRRIRRINGWLMMFLVIALACAAGLPASQRTFVMLWLIVAGLTGLVLIIAWMDAVNTLRLHRRDRARLRAHMRDLLARRAGRAAPESAEAPPSPLHRHHGNG